MSISVELKDLSKRFKNTMAIDSINLSLEENKIYGLIGRNGAGKTTLLKLIANQLVPSNGQIFINSQVLNPMNSCKDVCLVRERFHTKYDNLKAKDFIDIGKSVYTNWDNNMAEKLIKEFNLPLNKRHNKLSKGMQASIGLIIGMASRAAITLFDEPYVGLDPVARQIFYDVLREDYIINPRTIILSTHLIDEVEGIFEEIIMLDKGKVLLRDSLIDIQARSCVAAGNIKKIKDIFGYSILHTENIGEYANAAVLVDERALFEKAKEEGLELSNLSLQKLFIYLTTKSVDGRVS